MTELIRALGPAGVFLLMVPESACIPIPSELTLLFAGYAASRGWIAPAVAIGAATAGNLAGSLLAYAVGARRLADRVPGVRAVVARWGELLDRHGLRAVLIARVLPLARTFVSLPAGARRVPLGPFVALTIVGCGAWATAFVLVGLLAGGAWQAIDSVAGRALLVGGLLVLAVSLKRGQSSWLRRAQSSRR